MEAAQDLDLATHDLGPLAWVLDELRKSLESASSALRRFVRDAALARREDLSSVDTGQLRIARQHMHQAVGALEMVGLPAPAHVLRAVESAVQKFVERPELCSEAAAQKVERAGFALTEYLEAVLLGKPVSAVSLFPQYRDVQELSGADRVHPADLWLTDWRWNDPRSPQAGQPLGYDPAVRSRLDQAVLQVVKAADPQAARELVDISLALAASQAAGQPKVFWKIAAGYFEAVALQLLPADVYVKRAASRVLLQYATLAKGEPGVSDRLAQDLVFFCAQALPPAGEAARALAAVREAYGVASQLPVDYSTSPFGRFDPMVLAQARKRIGYAKDTWAGLSGGDVNKLKGVVDQFAQVTDALVKLYPPCAPLAQQLGTTIEAVARSGRPPNAELAMEVATAVLYIEAALQDLDPSDTQLARRTTRLAERLERVRLVGQPEPLESWMEELYRRVSDRQTMGSVVGELRGTLSELEKLLDQYFRNPADTGPLADAPAHLAQMRGVLSVLGMDQAASAVARMRDMVENMIVTEVDEERARAAGTFDKLGNNLGALGFLIDMLNYQPALAKRLFVYDEQRGELNPLMGRAMEPAAEAPPEPAAKAEGPVAVDFSLATVVMTAPAPPAARPPAAAVPPVPMPPPVAAAAVEEEDDELRQIFLEEAREVVGNGRAAVQALLTAPTDMVELTTLRRAFHTLKGSSRMVGLTEFGEAAWSMEQVLNTWLADQKAANDDLRSLADAALVAFGRWVEDIERHTDSAWKAAFFRAPAEAMRTQQQLLPIVGPQAAGDPAPAPEPAVFELPATEAPAPVAMEAESALDIDFSLPAGAPSQAPAQPAPEGAAAAPVSFELPSLDAAQEEEAVERGPATIAAEIPLDELPAEFGIDLGFGDAPQDALAAAAQPPEIDAIDFGSLSALADAASGPAMPLQAEPMEMPAIEAIDAIEIPAAQDIDDFVPQPVAAERPAEAVAQADTEAGTQADAEASHDEQVKVIGDLRINIPLYNVYLNEADEWSRRLVTEIGEWALEMNQPVPDSTIGWAHSLKGSSATVGFQTLSDIARALEDALEHAQTLALGTPQHAAAFIAAAEEIRRLLHQFAAGFLKEPDPNVVRSLHALAELDAPLRPDPRELPAESGFGEIDFAAAPGAPAAAAQDLPAPALPTPGAEPPLAEARALLEPFTAPELLPQPEPQLLAEPQPLSQQAEAAPVRLAPQVHVDGIERDDDIELADTIDPDLFPIFEEEGAELMPNLGAALRQWAGRPDNLGARDQALRALHTLKGSARLAGALRLGEMAHRLESDIEYLGAENVNPADIEQLLARFDAIQARFDVLRGQTAAAEEAGVPLEVSAPQPLRSELPARAPVQPAVDSAARPLKTALAAPSTLAVTAARTAASQAVRVRAQLLDRLVNQAGEVMITRSRLEEELRQLRASLADLTGNLDRLRSQLREIELQAETQMQSRLAQSRDTAAGFDPLEFDRFTRVQELTRLMAESVNDVATVQRNIQRVVEATEDDLIAQARQTRELQRDLLRTRMVEFEGIADRLYRVVRLAAKESGKQVKLEIVGGSIEMDRGVLDRMTPAFEHLLRNCVAHGIESPEQRVAAGKGAAGSITIELVQEGNDVSVSFRDDGAGLDVERIRDKALQLGLVTPGQTVNDADAASLVFLPGFSTATVVTAVAGRGIGMDVVRSEVNALGGRIETTSRRGRGASFRLVLPLTTAVTQVVMVRCGSLSVGVPANLIEIVRRATAQDVEQAYAAGAYEFGGERVPFFWAGSLLQSSGRSREPLGRTVPVIIFRSAAQRVAVHVDEVLGNQEVVVKNLGPQLSRLPGLAGMTVLASGAVVLIYNPVALAQVYGEQARQLSARDAAAEAAGALAAAAGAGGADAVAAPAAIPLVLVVDDSITVRRVTQRLLQREGYRVALAADGLQALERLAEERPAVVLSDIEMPRMDGFDLARNIRGESRTAGLPIIMITSRIAQKHRDHAQELGVNHYLGKPYSEEELLSLVRHYATVAAAA